MNTEDILRQEFSAESGSFLLQLRCNLHWDTEAFTRLTRAMLAYVRSHPDDQTLDRWVAEGFWYVSSFAKDCSSHKNFPRPHPPSYYEAAYERLHDLASWLFTGSSPYQGDTGFDDL